MSKELLEIEVGENTYKLGYPTREDIVKAEDMGLKLLELEEKPVKTTNMLFYTALLAKQPTITKDEAIKLLNQYIEEGGEIGEINLSLIHI